MSDAWRAVVAGCLLALCATLWSLWVASGALMPERVAEREGEAMLSLYQVISVDEDGGGVLAKGGRTARVDDLPDDVVVGEELTVGATLSPMGWRVRWVARHPLRPAKRWLGLVGLVVTGGLLAVGTRWRNGWLWFRG